MQELILLLAHLPVDVPLLEGVQVTPHAQLVVVRLSLDLLHHARPAAGLALALLLVHGLQHPHQLAILVILKHRVIAQIALQTLIEVVRLVPQPKDLLVELHLLRLRLHGLLSLALKDLVDLA